MESNGILPYLSFPKFIMDSTNNLESDNSVNGGIPRRITSSLGTVCCEQQATPDRHPATANIGRRITKDKKTKIATWNVRTLNRAGSKENIIQEMERLGIVILGLSEVRWTGSGKEQIGKDIMIYSGGEKYERGVAIIVSNTLKHNIIGYCAMSDRVLLVKFDNKHFNISVIQVYAPTQDATEEELEEFTTNWIKQDDIAKVRK